MSAEYFGRVLNDRKTLRSLGNEERIVACNKNHSPCTSSGACGVTPSSSRKGKPYEVITNPLNGVEVTQYISLEKADTLSDVIGFKKVTNALVKRKTSISIYDEDDDTTQVLGVEDLKKMALELAQENEFEMVEKEGWNKDFLPSDKLSESGYPFVRAWREDIDEESALFTCIDILSVFSPYGRV